MTFNIRNLDEVERERRLRDKEKAKDEISQDVQDVVSKIMDGFEKTSVERKKKRGIISKIIIISLIITAFLLIADMLLGSVWLIKFFIKSLFHI